MHPVGDHDDRRSAGAKPADELEEPLHLGVAERRGRLVENEDARLVAHRLRDLDHLPQVEREARDWSVDVDVRDTQTRERLARERPRACAREKPSPQREVAQDDVVHHRQLRHEREFLVDDADPGVPRRLRRLEDERPALDEHLARVRAHEPGDHLHERALAGAVLAEQGMHLRVSDRDVGAVECPNAAEVFLDGPSHQRGRTLLERCLHAPLLLGTRERTPAWGAAPFGAAPGSQVSSACT